MIAVKSVRFENLHTKTPPDALPAQSVVMTRTANVSEIESEIGTEKDIRATEIIVTTEITEEIAIMERDQAE